MAINRKLATLKRDPCYKLLKHMISNTLTNGRKHELEMVLNYYKEVFYDNIKFVCDNVLQGAEIIDLRRKLGDYNPINIDEFMDMCESDCPCKGGDEEIEEHSFVGERDYYE